MNITLDTNAYAALGRGSKKVLEYVQAADEIIMPVVVLGELWFGFYGGNKLDKNAQNLQKFLDNPRVSVALNDETSAELYGKLANGLKRSGKLIPTNDVWVAVTSLQNSSKLVTADSDFNNLPQLSLLSF
jgi:tRNA(fMet)-specific endonuclease VapC